MKQINKFTVSLAFGMGLLLGPLPKMASTKTCDLADSANRIQNDLAVREFTSLPPKDQTLIVIWQLEAEVNNGGFHQYYSNAAGENAEVAVHKLRVVGALQMAKIVLRANKLFYINGRSSVPRERKTRGDLVDQLSKNGDPWMNLDTQFWAYPNDVEHLLRQYYC